MSGYRVVLVGTSNGQIIEIRYHPYRQKLVRVVYSVLPQQVTALSASYLYTTALVIVGLSDGRILELRPTLTVGPVFYAAKTWFTRQRILAVAAFLLDDPRFYVSLEDGSIWQGNTNTSYLQLRQRRYAPINSMSATADDAFVSDLSGAAGFLWTGSRPYSPYPPITKVAAGEELWRRVWARGKFVYTDRCQP